MLEYGIGSEYREFILSCGLYLFTLFLFFQIYPDTKANAKTRKTSMEWIKKYLLEGKFTSVCSYSEQGLEIQLLFPPSSRVFSSELELNWHNYVYL